MMLGYRGQHGVIARAGATWAIGPAGRGDSAEVKRLFLRLHLYNASFDPHFALAEDWEEHFDAILARALAGDGQRRLLLARDAADGRPAGFVLAALHRDGALWKHRTWVEVEALYVERAWRGTGLAEALLAPICDWARDLGQARVQLYVTHTNERAVRFYEGQGFRPVQAIMRKALPAG
jgi:GNAT superfamily N-acetyltransferase